LVKGVARIPEVRSTGQVGNKRHGDSAIAHLLADYAAKNPTAPIEFTSLPSKDELELDDDFDGWAEVGCV
jgi:phage FluMu gp28-like protein